MEQVTMFFHGCQISLVRSDEGAAIAHGGFAAYQANPWIGELPTRVRGGFGAPNFDPDAVVETVFLPDLADKQRSVNDYEAWVGSHLGTPQMMHRRQLGEQATRHRRKRK